MGHVVPLHPRDHDEVRSLLPWYVGGRLDAPETARVEDHLAGCAECRAELEVERRLKAAVAALPTAVEDGWRRLESKMAAGPLSAARLARKRTGRARTFRALWGGLAIAASVAAIAVTLSPSPTAIRNRPTAGYHTLGAAAVSRAGNVVVVFRPETTERDLRAALRQSGARLVGGPTDADAYLVAVPQDRRSAVLTALRRSPNVVLAEPIDAADTR